MSALSTLARLSAGWTALFSTAFVLILLFITGSSVPSSHRADQPQHAEPTTLAGVAIESIAAVEASDEESVQDTATDIASPFVIASWNVNYGNRDALEIVKRVTGTNADVVCLQETTVPIESILWKQLKLRYPYSKAFGHKGDYFAERFAVMSKHKIDDIRFVPPTRSFFGHVVARLKIGERLLTIVNVHLTPFTGRGAENLPQLLLAMGQTEVDHQHEIDAVLKHITVDEATLVVGDFNSLSGFVAPNELKMQGLIDSFEELHEKPDQTLKTWHWSVGNLGDVRFRIDYIFHSPHFKAVRAEVRECPSSDHHLLLAELKWTTP